MPRYRVTNRVTKDAYEVEAPFAQTACDMLGWQIGNCHVQLLREGPFSNLRVHLRSPIREAQEGKNGLNGEP